MARLEKLTKEDKESLFLYNGGNCETGDTKEEEVDAGWGFFEMRICR